MILEHSATSSLNDLVRVVLAGEGVKFSAEPVVREDQTHHDARRLVLQT